MCYHNILNAEAALTDFSSARLQGDEQKYKAMTHFSFKFFLVCFGKYGSIFIKSMLSILTYKKFIIVIVSIF